MLPQKGSPEDYEEFLNTCSDCNFHCFDVDSLYRHRKEHLQLLKYKSRQSLKEKRNFRNRHFLCQFCEKTCSNLVNLANHHRKHIEGIGPIFDWEVDIQVWLSLNEEIQKYDFYCTTFPCQYCQEKYDSQWDLIKHKWSNHKEVITNEEKPFHCEYCDKIFFLKINFSLHIERNCPYKRANSIENLSTVRCKRRKTKQKLYSCNYCGKHFTTSWYLQKHKRNHKMERFTCEFCTSIYADKTKLESHIERNHSRLLEKNYISYEKYKMLQNNFYRCKNCTKTFLVKLNYDRHVETNCKELELFQCDLCPRKFVNSRSLQRHRLLHTNETLHQCRICLKRFLSLLNLRVHEDKDHKGYNTNNNCDEKSYMPAKKSKRYKSHYVFKCNFCTQQFTKLSSLKNHEKVHTDQTPYVCYICGKKFSTSSGRIRHVKNVHKMTKIDDIENLKKIIDDTMCIEDIIDKTKQEEIEDGIHDEMQVIIKEEEEIKEEVIGNLENFKKELDDPLFSNKCKMCGDTFALQNELLAHTVNCHKELNMYWINCEESARFTKEILSLKASNHIGDVNAVSPDCITCKDDSSSNYNVPQLNVSSERSNYLCLLCREEFSNLEQLCIHKKQVHCTVVCDNYGKKFETDCENLQHSSLHLCNDSGNYSMQEQSLLTFAGYLCISCNIKFDTEELLHQHQQKEHIGSGYFRDCLKDEDCNLLNYNNSNKVVNSDDNNKSTRKTCDEGYFSNSVGEAELNLSINFQEKNGDGSSKQNESTEKPNNRNQYICIVCNLIFHDAFLLHLHQKHKHPAYSCKICEDIFFFETELMEHVLTQHGYEDRDNFKKTIKKYFQEQEDPLTKVNNRRLKIKDWNEGSEENSLEDFSTCVYGNTLEEESDISTDSQLELEENNFLCKICKQIYESPYDLMVHSKVHYLNNQEEINLFSCCLCEFKFTELKLLYLHEARSHGMDNFNYTNTALDNYVSSYKCDLCLSHYCSSDLLQLHKTSDHQNEDCLEKSANSVQLNEVKELDNSVLNENVNNSISEIINKGGTGLLHESEEVSIAMDNVEESLELKRYMKVFTTFTFFHLKEEEKESGYDCKYCDKKCHLLSEFMVHSLIHERPDILENGTKSAYHLSNIKHLSTLKKSRFFPYKCTKCVTRFIYEVEFKNHLLIHDKNKSSIDSTHNLPRVSPSLYSCKLCKLEFVQMYNLLKHLFDNHGINAIKAKSNEISSLKISKKMPFSRLQMASNAKSKHIQELNLIEYKQLNADKNDTQSGINSLKTKSTSAITVPKKLIQENILNKDFDTRKLVFKLRHNYFSSGSNYNITRDHSGNVKPKILNKSWKKAKRIQVKRHYCCKICGLKSSSLHALRSHAKFKHTK